MRCPLCGASAQRNTRPFCSERCADIDLINWLNEGYRLPGAPADGPRDDHGEYR